MNTSRLDAIVIGSGAGGAAAAYRLVRGGLRVQLLGVRTFDCEPDLARILRRAAPHGGPWKAVPMPMALAPGILAERAEAMHFDGFASAQGLKADAERSLLSTLRGNDRFTLLTN